MLKPILKLLTLICIISSYVSNRYVEYNQWPEYDAVIWTECNLVTDQVNRLSGTIRERSKKSPSDTEAYYLILELLEPINAQTTLEEVQHIHTIITAQFSSYIEHSSWAKACSVLKPDAYFCANVYSLAVTQGLSDGLNFSQDFNIPTPQLFLMELDRVSNTLHSFEYMLGYSYHSSHPSIKAYNGNVALSEDEFPFHFPYNTDSLRIEIANPVTGETKRIYAQP